MLFFSIITFLEKEHYTNLLPAVTRPYAIIAENSCPLARQFKCRKQQTCVKMRVSELLLSKLSTNLMDWKSSWMLERNCSSSIPHVALE